MPLLNILITYATYNLLDNTVVMPGVEYLDWNHSELVLPAYEKTLANEIMTIVC